jgi:hypothetical protein
MHRTTATPPHVRNRPNHFHFDFRFFLRCLFWRSYCASFGGNLAELGPHVERVDEQRWFDVVCAKNSFRAKRASLRRGQFYVEYQAMATCATVKRCCCQRKIRISFTLCTFAAQMCRSPDDSFEHTHETKRTNGHTLAHPTFAASLIHPRSRRRRRRRRRQASTNELQTLGQLLAFSVTRAANALVGGSAAIVCTAAVVCLSELVFDSIRFNDI